MIYRIYSIRDSVADESGPLIIAPNDGVALRYLRQVLKDLPPGADTEFDLQYVGDWDNESGLIVSTKTVPDSIRYNFRGDDFNPPLKR